jgi:hypothetical protein
MLAIEIGKPRRRFANLVLYLLGIRFMAARAKPA